MLTTSPISCCWPRDRLEPSSACLTVAVTRCGEFAEVAAKGDPVDDHEQDQRSDPGNQEQEVEGQREEIEQEDPGA